MVTAVLIYVMLPWRADACSISLATVHVSPDFRVIVQHGTTPIPGIKLEVYDQAELEGKSGDAQWKPIQMLATGSDGAVEIHNLRPGRYLVETTGPGAGSAVYALVSTRPEKLSNEISLEWPTSRGEIVKVKTLTGELASTNPWTPFENIHTELWAAGVREPLAVQDTGANGHFRFKETKPGIYILRIRGQQKNARYDSRVEGDIPFELLPAAKDSPETLSLYLSMTTCGISYSSCPSPSSNVMPSRRLQVHDPLGAVITQAKYRVLDSGGAEIAAGSTGSKGIVELSSELNGKVTLVVAGSGSKTFALPLDLIAPTDTAEYLFVEMGVQGYGGYRCSAASLEKNAP
jgi:hypothetical protein